MANKKMINDKENEEKLVLAKSIAARGKKVANTYANFENTIVRIFKYLSNLFDRIVLNPKSSGVVSLVLAIFVYMTVTNGWVTQSVTTYTETIENVVLKSVANTEVYEITGLPETVTIKVSGEMNDVQLTKNSKSYQVIADLSSLSEGTHIVNFVPSDFSTRVDVTVEPASAQVTIKKRISKQFTIGYDFINTDKMDSKLVLSTPVFETNEVIVRASQSTVDNIALIKALIDVKDIDSSFEQYATLVAYDNEGNKVEASMLPSTVKVNVEVTSPSKELPIVIIPKGELPNNKAIESITMDHAAITIYGPESVLNTMNSFIVNIDVSEMVSDSSKVAIISLPSGVTESSISKVNLEIKLCEAESKTIENVQLLWKNLSVSKFSITNQEDSYIDVVVTGSKEAIENLTADDIELYADMSSITTTTTASVPLVASGPSYLVKYEPVKDSVEFSFVK